MRTINAGALAEMNKQFGVESIIIVRVFWGPNQYSDYADKEYPEYGIQGRILSLSGVDDVVGLSGSKSSASVTVSLSDHDTALKNIFNTTDLHKLRAVVIQWFDGIPLTEGFILLDGVINTPISWKEGNRTLDFTIMTPLENLELGFSPDESYFNQLPHNILGQPFPLIFGRNLRVKALRISEAPSILLTKGIGIVDEDLWAQEILDLAENAIQAFRSAMYAYQAGVASALIASTYNDGIESSHIGFGGVLIIDNPADDFATYKQYFDQAQQQYKQSNDYMIEYYKVQAEIVQKKEELDRQRGFNIRSVPIISETAPRGVPLIVEMGGVRWNARIDGVQLTLSDEITPETVQKTYIQTLQTFKPAPVVNPGGPNIVVAGVTGGGYTTATAGHAYGGAKDQGQSTQTSTNYVGTRAREKFRWIPGGTRIKVLNTPLKYIVSLGNANVFGVFGKQQGMFVQLPAGTYSRVNVPFQRQDGIIVTATAIVLPQPLTNLLNEQGDQIWEDDDIYVNVDGPVPGTMVDIMVYCIQNFSNLTYDPGSFGQARLYTDQIAFNHVVRERLDTLKYIDSLAFMGKCALWVKDQTVYIRYLPLEPTPVGTISTTDLIEDSLEITSNSTDSLVTKFIASWKFDEDQSQNNEMVFRYNIFKYGVHDETFNYFAFNSPDSVGWSARYWIIRKSNLFKIIKFKTDLSKLNFETFDPVLMNMPGLISNNPVVGIIESCIYNSDNSEVDMSVWIPVRLGEMDQYRFAYPTGELVYFGEPSDPGIYTGNPLQNLTDPTRFMVGTRNEYVVSSLGDYTPAKSINMEDSGQDGGDADVQTFIMDLPVDFAQPRDLSKMNDYNQRDITTPPTIEDPTLNTAGNAFIGRIVGQQTEGQYNVRLIGLDRTVIVSQLLQGVGTDPIPVGTPVYVVRNSGRYYMQAPVWLAEPE